MSHTTSSAAQDSVKTTQNQERYIEELAGPNDYWLTITDAARATRRQDVSIRRWISKGLLPVKRQHVGLNQRTRLVRASDLAALTPIIDPSAAISTDLGRLDLTSIPVQQAQIRESQQQITTHLETLNNYVNKETETLQQQILVQQASLTSLQAHLEQHITLLQATIAQQRDDTSASLEGLRNALQAATAQNLAQVETMNGIMLNQLNSLRKSVDQRLAEVSTTFQETISHLQHLIDACTTNIQQERMAREQLAQHVANISSQLAQQRQQLEQESSYHQHLVEQLAHITTDITSQQHHLEGIDDIQSHVQYRLVELQSQSTEKQHLDEQRYSDFLNSLAKQQLVQQAFQVNLTSLTHRLQDLKTPNYDYVNLIERVEALERTVAETRHFAKHEQEQENVE